MKIAVRNITISLFMISSVFVISFVSYGQDSTAREDTKFNHVDSSAGNIDSLINLNNQTKVINELSGPNYFRTRIDTSVINATPYISLQQMLKGGVAGVYAPESNGEPGAVQYMFIHGLSSPLLSIQNVLSQQPAVFLNGVPLIQDNGMTYNIQSTDFNSIGPATNLLATLNPDDIESIQILKDPATLSKLGPVAANGAIWVLTKNAHSGLRDISVNSYFGVAHAPSVTPVNAAYENAFRQPFYQKYATQAQQQAYPVYLRDSTDMEYYGPANWTDLYFKNKPFYAANMSLTGGSNRANFRFEVNDTKSVSGQDGANVDRYGVGLFMNMSPIKWLTVSSMIYANRLQRMRNRNIRDRLAEVRYTPDLTNPLPPNKDAYGQYLSAFDDAVDDNKVNAIQGYFSLSANWSRLSLLSKISVDYNEGIRDAFWPTTLLSGNNFVSNYFGYNERFLVSNTVDYDLSPNKTHKINIEGGQSYQSDINTYQYAYGYNTPNDYIKIRTDSINGNGDLVNIFDMQYFPFGQTMRQHLMSFYGEVKYTYNDFLTLSALVRHDGSSYIQPNKRWITTPVFSLAWNIHRNFFSYNTTFSTLNLRASYGRFAKLYNTDRYSLGPLYVVDGGWTSEPEIGSYDGMASASRPYNSGWVGYNVGWQYSNKLNVGLDLGFFGDRLMVSADIYNDESKNMLLPVPVPEEYGYSSAYESGMAVNNKGIDVSISGNVVKGYIEGALDWTTTINFNVNKNKLTALPNGLTSLIIGSNMLQVGKSVDAFWLYQNNGIYNAVSDIPVNPKTGAREAFNGLALNAGDPNWRDVNGDYDIDNNDKILMGHSMPVFTGGFGNSISYKKFQLNFQFYFALGQKVLNQQIANHLNFINNDGSSDLSSVKEITFWEKTFNPSAYPMYNPWSDVVPYQVDQSLFLQNASFAKLRSVSLGYDISSEKGVIKKSTFRRFLVYVSATNLFTISPFKNGDPELASYNGYYTGYNQEIPRTFMAGVKIDL